MKHRQKAQNALMGWKIKLAVWIAVLAAVLSIGCGRTEDAEMAMRPAPEPSVEESSSVREPSFVAESSTAELSSREKASSAAEPSSGEKSSSAAESSSEKKPSSATESSSEERSSSVAESSAETAIAEDGSYTSKEDVALYLETYDKLPGNFITKKEAQELGWTGGSLEPYAPGKCIGGDKFGNYEGLLPKEDGRTYKECDIDTLGAKSRGAKRIVYSNDGLIYYTEDHYASFELLYN